MTFHNKDDALSNRRYRPVSSFRISGRQCGNVIKDDPLLCAELKAVVVRDIKEAEPEKADLWEQEDHGILCPKPRVTKGKSKRTKVKRTVIKQKKQPIQTASDARKWSPVGQMRFKQSCCVHVCSPSVWKQLIHASCTAVLPVNHL